MDPVFCKLSLSIAAGKGDLAQVKDIIRLQDGNPESKDHNGMTALLNAAHQGHRKVVCFLLCHHADLHATCPRKRNALMYAAGCSHRNTEVIQLLLTSGISVNDVSNNEERTTALIEAAQHGVLKNVKQLVQFGADIEFKDAYGNSALHYACRRGHTETAEYLMSVAANLHALGAKGHTALMSVVSTRRLNSGNIKHPTWCPSTQIMKQLVQSGVSVNAASQHDEWKTALIEACQYGTLQTVRSLVELGAGLELKDGKGNLPLHQASYCNNESIVAYLLSQGADINASGHRNMNPLMYAALSKSPNAKVINLLIQAGISVNEVSKNQDGITALILASNYGVAKNVRMFVELKADVEQTDGFGNTALIIACHKGSIQNVVTLVQNGADIEQSDRYGSTALHHACMKGWREIVEYLLLHNANIQTWGRWGRNSLMFAAGCKTPNCDIIKLLIQSGVSINAVSNHEEAASAFVIACSIGNVENVKTLVEHGVDKDKGTLDGYLPLMFASFHAQTDTVEYLLSVGANVNQRGWRGRNALMAAAKCKNPNAFIIRLLIKSGVPVNAVSNYDERTTALILACIYGIVDNVRILVESGADKEQKDSYGDSPLHCACFYGNIDTVNYLLSAGGNVHTLGSDGKTLLMSAAESKTPQPDVIVLLIKYGVPVNATSKSFKRTTALLLACQEGDIENVKSLVEYGADVEQADRFGRTPLHYAGKRKDNKHIYKYLLVNGADENALSFTGYVTNFHKNMFM